MKRIQRLVVVITALALAVLGGTTTSAQDKQDKYTLKVPGGLAFSEFKGYEDWQAVGPSQTDAANVIRLIVANPVMIDAYRGCSRQWQGLPRRLQDCEDCVDTEKANESTFFREHPRHGAW